MRKHNTENERVKREYLRWLKNAQGRSGATLDIIAAALDRFDQHNGRRNFKAFHFEQAMSFKEHLAARRHHRTGKPLSPATIHSTLKAVQGFFEWLSREEGYRRTVRFRDAAYFRPSDNDVRAATAPRERPAPSLDQVRRAVLAMPTSTPAERRNRAVIALIALTGARDGAVASLRLKHLDVGAGVLFQDPREVHTKRSKAITSVFYPIGDDFAEIVAEWDRELREDHHFGPDDPLFPATEVGTDGDGLFAATGIERRQWGSAGPIRAIFREAFEAVGLPYFSPHSLRRTLMRVAYQRNLTQQQMKAWSQNLGHESVQTSLASYGTLSFDEQADVIRTIAAADEDPDAEVMEIARQIMAMRRPRKAA